MREEEEGRGRGRGGGRGGGGGGGGGEGVVKFLPNIVYTVHSVAGPIG